MGGEKDIRLEMNAALVSSLATTALAHNAVSAVWALKAVVQRCGLIAFGFVLAGGGRELPKFACLPAFPQMSRWRTLLYTERLPRTRRYRRVACQSVSFGVIRRIDVLGRYTFCGMSRLLVCACHPFPGKKTVLISTCNVPRSYV